MLEQPVKSNGCSSIQFLYVKKVLLTFLGGKKVQFPEI